MIDVELIRENPEKIKKGLENRQKDTEIVDRIQEVDEEWRSSKKKADDARMQHNKVTEEIEDLVQKGEDTEDLIEKASDLKDEVNKVEEKSKDLKKRRDELLLQIPQIPEDNVTVGKDEDDNVEIITEGFEELRELPDQVVPHYELGEKNNWIDEERARKTTGSGNYFLKGDVARLEHALIQFMMDIHREQGYTDVFPPVTVNSQSMEGTAQLPKFGEDSYKIEDEDLWLCPTAEVPVTNMYREEIIDTDSLPIKHQAYTPSFRREAGEHGTETRGIARVHQFNKVELVQFVEPNNSYEHMYDILEDAEQILKRLGLPYRQLELCTGDLGFKTTKQIDLEVWAPGTNTDEGPEEGGRWLEVSTVSNFEDFQARRMNLRTRNKRHEDTEYLHTLNGSGLALPRVVIAVLEYYQNEDGTVDVPRALRNYVNKDVLEPNKEIQNN